MLCKIQHHQSCSVNPSRQVLLRTLVLFKQETGDRPDNTATMSLKTVMVLMLLGMLMVVLVQTAPQSHDATTPQTATCQLMKKLGIACKSSSIWN
ncbi:hypothetical protein RRG08_043340 [Elysia crispata]|uniref:Uncharacterized protein n=1 Tax=Elysia crispata TaxID=231223 RepID=A0AAE1BBK4_9GAST|nr:hypothetical protein RRG08_043340 [Elysia crispata]